jgi:hypothetical protein
LEKRASGQGSRYSWSFDPAYEIYEADTRGNILRRLTTAEGYDAEGSWSPVGKTIVFASNRHAYTGDLSDDARAALEQDASRSMEIYIMDADGGQVRRLTDSPGYDGGPFFSADGKQLSWASSRTVDKQAEIFTADRDDAAARALLGLDKTEDTETSPDPTSGMGMPAPTRAEIAAEDLATRKARGALDLRHDVIFAAWTGEEMGRLGSAAFVEARTPGDAGLGGQVLAYLNLDMIGRLDSHLSMQGAGSSSLWRGEIERRNIPVGLPLQVQDDAYLPTDSTSFYLAGVPVLSFFTGVHQDYNTSRDTADRMTYEGLTRVARLAGLLAASSRLYAIGRAKRSYSIITLTDALPVIFGKVGGATVSASISAWSSCSLPPPQAMICAWTSPLILRLCLAFQSVPPSATRVRLGSKWKSTFFLDCGPQ